MAATPEWADLLQTAVETGLADVHTAMPGQVVRVVPDGQQQLVDVRPCLRRAVPTDDGTAPFVEEDLPILPRVPVGYPQGGGFFLSWPLKPGDFVTLVFAERSIDRWLATASKARQAAVSTGDVGMHTLDGAIALPVGPAPLANLLQGVSADDLVIGVSGGDAIRIQPDGTIVFGGGSGPRSMAIAELVATELARVKADLSALKAAANAAFGACMPAGGAPTPPQALFDAGTAAVPSNPGSVAASKVKSD
jgi:hypothetical protein